MTGITFTGVEKRFGDVLAVDKFDLNVRAGEFIVLVGPSGCGKTTSLRMLAGLERPDGGTIHLGETDVTYMPAKDRNLAMVFQSYALYPHMSVAENIGFALRLRGKSKAEIEQEVTQAATLMGILPYLQRKPRELSGGQRQRVAVCRAIVRHPDAFLFDEPLSNLDAKLRTSARTEIRSLQQRLGTTTLYVTHDQVEAMTMADRMVIMRDGHIQQIGHPLEIYRRPANAFVAGFIGNPAMNLITGHYDAADRIAARAFTLTSLLRQPAGTETLIGLRPEDIFMRAADCAAPLPFNAAIRHVEQLGNETLVHIDGGDMVLQARIPAAAHILPGSRADFYVDQSRIHLFSAQTGQRMEMPA